MLSKEKYSWIILIAVIFIFFNRVLLPGGLLFTIVLAPLFYVWLLKEKVPINKYLLYYFIIVIIYFIIQNSNGIVLKDYLVSSTVIFTVFISSVIFYTYFKKYGFTFEKITKKILKLNLLLIAIAILLLPLGEKNVMWNFGEFKTGRTSFPRLNLFASEPSHYSYMIAPFALFYFQYFFFRNLNIRRMGYLLIILLSLCLSFSYGIISGLLIALLLSMFLNLLLWKRLRNSLRLLLFFSIVLAALLMLLFGPFRDTVAVQRIADILQGNDSSVNNRSWQAFFLADQIAASKSRYFGIGPGQLKIIGADLIHEMYGNSDEDKASLPSSLADTIAVFGYIGAGFKLFFELLLFYKTKVFSSSYRFCVFLFTFWMQFVHGYVTYLEEYFLWTLAFSGLFPDQYFMALQTKNKTEFNGNVLL